MSRNPILSICPPLVNSSNPWATTAADLLALYNCPFTGAVTTRTSLLGKGFNQHPSTHQYTFFSTSLGHATSKIDVSGEEGRGEVKEGEGSSLNNLGYSPVPFEGYIEIVKGILERGNDERRREERDTRKPFIFSVTGTKEEVGIMYGRLISLQREMKENEPGRANELGGENSNVRFMLEINLSCPNIPSKPPPAYDSTMLKEYLLEMQRVQKEMNCNAWELPVGIKTPPYTYSAQFTMVMDCLEALVSSREKDVETIWKIDTESLEQSQNHPISFITATNTLGSCFVADETNRAAALSSSQASVCKGDTSNNGKSRSLDGIGGLGGEAIHALSLGNVKTLRKLLDDSRYECLRRIGIIGVGGVSDHGGFERMRFVGADVVGVGTGFGRQGLGVFEKIMNGKGKSE